MERMNFNLGKSPTITIDDVLGKLQIKGWDSEEIYCESKQRDFIDTKKTDETLTLSSKGNCSLRVPLNSNLVIRSIKGSLEINHVSGQIEVHEVMGAVNVFNSSSFSADKIHGNANIYHIDDFLILHTVNGNLSLKDVFGSATINKCAGNVSVSGISGGFDLVSSGNAIFNFDPDPGKDYKVVSNGNLFCQVPANAGFEAKLNSGAGIVINAPIIEVEETGPDSKHIQIGDGSSNFQFTANGKITISVEGHYGKFSKDSKRGFIDDIVNFSSSIVEETIEKLESSLADLNNDLQDLTISLGSDKNALRKTRKEILKARRNLERNLAASRRQISRSARRRVSGSDLVAKRRSDEPVSNKERVKILQMVESGLINVGEAELLLAAIEGNDPDISE